MIKKRLSLPLFLDPSAPFPFHSFTTRTTVQPCSHHLAGSIYLCPLFCFPTTGASKNPMSIFSIDDVTSNDEAAIASSIQQVVNASAPQVNSMTQASKLANKFAWTHPLKSNPSLVISVCIMYLRQHLWPQFLDIQQHQEYRQPASGETRVCSPTFDVFLLVC